MSALSYVCGYGYGSNSDDSDCEYGIPCNKRPKLPPPDLSKVPVVPSEEHADYPQLHGGRARSFPHIRGNWATFIFVPIPEEESIVKIVDKLQKELISIGESSQICDNLHVSLSKIVVLKYHEIKSFTSTLQESLQKLKSFRLVFDSVEIYCNEEKTRTFIALKVDYCSNEFLSQISRIVDQVLVEYKLPTLYEKPSFHVSVLWVHGNKVTEISCILSTLNTVLLQEIEVTPAELFTTQIHCKSGNKYFQYSLLP